MISCNNVSVWGFDHAVRGMRAPYMSYSKSDSYYDIDNPPYRYVIGDADMALMQRLFKGGSEHRKFLRQVFVSMDLTAPLYWWKQFDKYQIGVTTDSESTMHTLAKNPITIDDFSFDGMEHIDSVMKMERMLSIAEGIVDRCEEVRKEYAITKDPMIWRFLVQILPESYNQTRVITFNYEVAATIIKQRSGHKLSEWEEFIEVLKELPYLSKIMGGES